MISLVKQAANGAIGFYYILARTVCQKLRIGVFLALCIAAQHDLRQILAAFLVQWFQRTAQLAPKVVTVLDFLTHSTYSHVEERPELRDFLSNAVRRFDR